jgi:hypothetical protein
VPYRVDIPARVRRQIRSWPMPDVLIVDCYERLNALRDNPAMSLVRTERPFDGMTLAFEIVDPTNRLVLHRFAFLAVYGIDEETLFIDAAAHERFSVGG